MSIPLNLDGYTDLPPGKIAAVVTYLEMTEPPPPAAPAPPAGLTLERAVAPTDLDLYRRLFRRIGEEWLWFSRLNMADDELRATVDHPQVDLYFVSHGGESEGILELDRREFPDIEIAFFGLSPALQGRGAGRWLMDRATEIAWAHQPRRLWLHTCTLDHHKALGFYRRAGFRAYRRALEVADDPRLNGKLPRQAAPQVPLLPPAKE